MSESGDKYVDRVREKFLVRSKRGQEKYGHSLERTDLSNLEWLQHLQEELMDAALYLERCMASHALQEEILDETPANQTP